ncbi:MAG: metal-dependent hydrolase [Congregibacter sp.]
MDPLSQGALGAALPQSIAKSQHFGRALFCGLLAGMAPDLDVLISSSTDPLLFLEYHRQFTHSLVFIPFGAALVASLIWLFVGRSRSWSKRSVFAYCLLGYATHALLDACTTYGTLLLWPFSQERFAWNNISIIDPLFTLPLVFGVLLSRSRGSRWPAAIALAWGLSYLALGVVAREAAKSEAWAIAAQRGHQPEAVDVKPSFANLLVWKTIYFSEGRYFVDAVRLGPQVVVYPGDSVAAFNYQEDMPGLRRDSLQGRDVERFRWFSMGYIALHPEYPDRVMDLRFSLLPNQIKPLWSIRIDLQSQDETHVLYQSERGAAGAALRQLFAMIRGQPQTFSAASTAAPGDRPTPSR